MAKKSVFLIRGARRAKVSALFRRLNYLLKMDTKDAEHNTQFPEEEVERFVDSPDIKGACTKLQQRCIQMLAKQV